MEVDYLQAVITVDINIDIIFPKGTLETASTKISEGNQELAQMYRDILKNQMNMQLDVLPRTAKIKWSNLKEIIEEPEPKVEE